MNDYQVKKYLSRLTNVPLVPRKFVGAMADVLGVTFLRNRGLKWQEYQEGDPMQDCPPEMKAEIENVMNDFRQRFAHSMGQQNPSLDTKLIFAYYAKDPAISAEKLASVRNSPNFAKYQEVTDFINSHGLRLWLSPNGIHNYVRQTGRKGDMNAVNGSQKYFENFGYAWGAKKAPVNRNIRRADYLPPEKAHQLMQNPEQLGDESIIVKVVTAQKNGGWGVFFTDQTKLFPVIGDNYYAQSRANEGDTGFADKSMFAATKGQHRKFFGYKTNEGRGKSFTLPTQTQFRLPNGPQDPNPQPVHKGGLAEIGRGDRYYLWIKNDGTLWWLPSHEAKGILGGAGGQAIPLTKEQVDKFNLENGEFFVLTNPDKFVYSWDTLDPVSKKKAEQDFREKTDIMNQMYDEISNANPDQLLHVGLNAFKYCIIGPAFKQGANYDEKQTTGNLPYSTTYLGDQAEVGQKLPNQSVVRREDWIVVADEFNTQRAQSTGTHGFQVAQSMDGLNALSGSATLMEALNKAFGTWAINAPFPPENVIEEAQRVFDSVHNPAALAPEQAQPAVTGLEGQQGQNPAAPAPQIPPQHQQQPQPQPQPIKQPVGNMQTVKPKSALNISGSNLINKLRKLG